MSGHPWYASVAARLLGSAATRLAAATLTCTGRGASREQGLRLACSRAPQRIVERGVTSSIGRGDARVRLQQLGAGLGPFATASQHQGSDTVVIGCLDPGPPCQQHGHCADGTRVGRVVQRGASELVGRVHAILAQQHLECRDVILRGRAPQCAALRGFVGQQVLRTEFQRQCLTPQEGLSVRITEFRRAGQPTACRRSIRRFVGGEQCRETVRCASVAGVRSRLEESRSLRCILRSAEPGEVHRPKQYWPPAWPCPDRSVNTLIALV